MPTINIDFSSPLLPPARTRLPRSFRAWVARRLSGPPAGKAKAHWSAVIYQLDRLGDFVLAASAIRALLNAWGEDKCLLMVSAAAAPLAEREFPRTARIALQTNAPSLTRDFIPAWWYERPKLRGHDTDRVVCFSHHRDLYKQTALSWIQTRRSYLLDQSMYPQAVEPPWCMELLAHRQLTESALGSAITLDQIRPQLHSIAARDGAELVVCPIAEEKERCMPENILISALQLWRRRSKAPIVLSAGSAAAASIERLASRLLGAGVDRVRTATSDPFEAFLQRIAHAGGVLAIDSAPAHIATALDKRLVSIPGGGRFGLCSPWQTSPRQVVVQHAVPCYGCGWRCSQPEPICLTRLSPEEIAAALPAFS